MVLIGAGISRVLCHLLGYFYPAYQTFKAVQGNDEMIYTQWLTYWIVNTYFTVFELIGDNFVSQWFPLYYEAKVALLVWLVTPQFMGATKIYRGILAPYMTHFETDIDNKVKEFQQQSAEHIGNLGRESIKKIQQGGVEVVKMGVKQIVQMQVNATMEELQGGGPKYGNLESDNSAEQVRSNKTNDNDTIETEIDYEELYRRAASAKSFATVDSDSDYDLSD
mmetsp:Transcript_19965/g.24207  ORF Transcript_19965/g.24207 Transcript_19965/m.24207 type:complete len:222 (+) Transcript_19965:197-862(+)|eukprot:CAMPEP_0204829118 /NCGR_PEP_ID=MMETSP1346-20131115/7148_1 /ASSEMBLY_ACC=CAM_ASM_000771 /TAXON_ID=215587 /ORGANISM="Aplanochytrium stocchinoi, Strain GSBS06" /LENGTH=221 /DNA_ID=CAMNT_0051958651 /DNA_START=191 /DNA_END=856 /DNA_ORIENTATION=-